MRLFVLKAVLEVDFDSSAHAKKALAVLKKSQLKGETTIELTVTGKTVKAVVKAPRFAVLRARVTSLLRDFKVIQDAFSLSK